MLKEGNRYKYSEICLRQMKKVKLLRSSCPVIIFLMVYFSIVITLLPVSYHCYDDRAIELDLMGGYINPFLSFPVSWVLSSLYGLLNIPWYPLFLYLLHGIAIFLLIKNLQKFVFSRPLVYFIIGFLVTLSLYFHVILTFTTAGFMIAIAGITSFLMHLFSRNISWLKVLLYGLCFAMGFLVRPPVLSGMMFFSGIFLLYTVVFVKEKRWKVALFLVPAIVFYLINSLIIADIHASSEYWQFNRLRGMFHEWPIIWYNADNQEILEKNNWTENDYWLLADGFSMHEKKYNIQTLENIFKYSKELPQEKNFIETLYTFNSISGFRSKFRVFLYSIYTLLLITLIYVPSKYWWVIFGYNAFALYSFVWAFHYYRFPFRAGAPLFFLVICLTIFLLGVLHRRTKVSAWLTEKNIPVLPLLFVLLTAMALYRQERDQLGDLREGHKRMNHIRQVLNEKYPSSVILMPIPYQFVHPFRRDSQHYTVLEAGWSTYSDRYYDEISRYLSVEKASQVLPALMDKPDGYILGGEIFVKRIVRFMKETYDIESEAEVVHSFPYYPFRPEEVAPTTLYCLKPVKNREF